MKKSLFTKATSLALTLLLLGSTIDTGVFLRTKAEDVCVFTDVCDKGAAYYEAVAYLKDKQLLKGNPDGSFQPEKAVNRAELLTILFRGFGGSQTFDKNQSFQDIKGNEWFAPYVSTAKSQGLVKGYPDGSFRAGNDVKLEETVKMIASFYHLPLPSVVRQEGSLARPLFGNEATSNQLWPIQLTEKDNIQDNQWYTPLMKILYDFNIHDPYPANPETGIAELELGKALSRKEVATILYKTIQAKDELAGPLKLISTWDSYQGNIKNKQDVYLYFNKPVKLSEARASISLKKDGVPLTDYQLYETAWDYDFEQANIPANYPWKPFELRIDSKVFGQTGTIELQLKKGLLDIYGQRLEKDQNFAFTLTENSAYMKVTGPSYFAAGGTMKNTVEHENITTLSSYICKVSTEKYLSTFKINHERAYDRHPFTTNESIDFSGDPQKNTTLASLCSNPKSKDLGGSSTRQSKEYDLKDLNGGDLTPGIYFSAFSAPEFYKIRSSQNTQRFVYVSDTALTMKTDPTGLSTVWALDLASAKPRAQMELKLYEITRTDTGVKKSTYLQSSTTSNEGKALFTLPNVGSYPTPEYVIVLESEGHFGLVNSQWSNGIEPYQYGLDTYSGYYGHDPKNEYTIYMHTDRKIYRPGHTVEIKGILRKRTLKGYDLPSLKTVLLSVSDANSKEIFTKEVTLGSNGSFTASLPLVENSATGSYTIVTHTPTPVDKDNYGETTASFEVEEYRKPDFKVDYTLEDSYNNGDTLKTTIEGQYYFGTPVQNATAHIELSRESLYINANTEVWYNFFNTYACYFYCKDTSMGSYTNDVTLNADGKAPVSIPLSLDDTTSSGLYTMTVTITDPNGRQVTNTKSFKVHKSQIYAGIRAISYTAAPGNPVSFEVYTMDTKSAVKANQAVKVAFYKENWTGYQSQDMSGDMMANSEHQDVVQSETTATTNNDGKTTVSFTPKEAGTYYALVTTTDSKGNSSSARDYTYIYASDSSYIPWAENDAFKVQVLLDKPGYKVGDTAKLIIQSPFPKATALITIEREKVLDSYLVELVNNTTPVSLPISASYLPNAYVSVSLFSTSGTPDFRQGYGKIFVDTTQQELHIALTTDKKVYAPREQVTVHVSTTDSTGKKVPAEVSLATVDEAVIALAGSVDRDIMNAFYYFRGIVVDTASSLTHLVQKSILETVGGSGKGGSSGLPIKRGNMKDTAYWNGQVQTDNNGEATISFTLPDNLTQWEILSIGATTDTKVGSAAISIESHQDTVAQPIIPRFVRVGDTVKLTYSVFNLTDAERMMNVKLSIPELSSFGTKTAQITIGKNGIGTISWDVVAEDIPTMTLHFEALDSNNKGDIVESTLPVLPAQVVDTIGISGKGTGSFMITLPSTLSQAELSTSSMTLSLSSSPLGTLKKQLSYLQQYPYGCSEQTTSVLLSNIILKKYLETTHIHLENVTTEKLEQNITAAFERLYNYQSDNGGWSLWGGEDYVDSYLTTYVLSALVQAEENGFGVDVNVVKKGRDYLMKELSQGKISDPEGKAFALTVLKKLGVQSIPTYADTLYKGKSTLSTKTKSYLTMLYSDLFLETGTSLYKERADSLSKDILASLDKDATYAWVKNMNSDTNYYYSYNDIQKNALALEALTKTMPKEALLMNMTAYLISQSQEERWATTHDTMAIIQGIDAYMSSHQEETTAFDASVSLGGKVIGKASFPEGGLSDATTINLSAKDLPLGALNLSIDAPKGRTVFYQNALTYQKSAKNQYVETSQFIVSRKLAYYLPDGSMTEKAPVLKIGSKVRVTLSFTPRYMDGGKNKKIAIEDHLPAGLEALNPGIRTSGKTDISFSKGWADHVEMRDDRVFLFSQDANAFEFSYDAQAISSGTFSYPAIHAFEMYHPEVYAKSGATALRVEK